jgi:hypothetical protein
MIRYTSTLKQEYGEELEQLMFFNPGQQAALAAIVDSVEMYGLPSVYADDGRLKINVENSMKCRRCSRWMEIGWSVCWYIRVSSSFVW